MAPLALVSTLGSPDMNKLPAFDAADVIDIELMDAVGDVAALLLDAAGRDGYTSPAVTSLNQAYAQWDAMPEHDLDTVLDLKLAVTGLVDEVNLSGAR